MHRPRNIGNESKRAKTTIPVYYISTTFSEKANSPEQRRILVSKIIENIRS